MFIVYEDNLAKHIRPTPLISISHSPNKNKMGTVGCTYTITLNGTIIAHEGSPVYTTPIGITPIATPILSNSYDPPPPRHINPDIGDRLTSIMLKQNVIRNLFSKDGKKCEIKSLTNIKANGATGITFYPNVISVDFQDGPYIDTCKYTITLETPLLFNKSGEVYTEGVVGSTFAPQKFDLQRLPNHYLAQDKTNINQLLNTWGGLVEDFTDTWSLETDESNAQYVDLDVVPVSYRVTRNVTAVGQRIPSGVVGLTREIPAWENAVGFIKKTILQETSSDSIGYSNNNNSDQYPGFRTNDTRLGSKYSKDMLNLPDYYHGYNHLRSMNINRTEGSCAITDTWILASGQSHLENYTIALDASSDGNAFTNVKLEGTIKGLSNLDASGYQNQTLNPINGNHPFIKAQNHYFTISDSGKFGVGSILFRRANNIASPAVLNSQPLSISLGLNELAGEITYSLEFNDRPYNYFSGVLAENISVNDTYPGDVFAIIPVIGRKTGPILQYLKGRTEYSRNANIEILLDYTDIPYSSGREYMLYRPSLNSTIGLQLLNLVKELSPSGEPNVSQYFLQPPTETWSPKEGRYTLNLNWIYQKSI